MHPPNLNEIPMLRTLSFPSVFRMLANALQSYPLTQTNALGSFDDDFFLFARRFSSHSRRLVDVDEGFGGGFCKLMGTLTNIPLHRYC